MYETYKNKVMQHGSNIYAKEYDMSKATMCTYPQSYHALPHWKYVFCCRSNFHISIFLTKKQIKM